ncbi:hypothetical protein Tco_1539546 [Tanacetum coccineum]
MIQPELGAIAQGYFKVRKCHLSVDKVKMDNPNFTMEEYIRLEEEKARRRGKVYNRETAKYGKILYDKDVYDLGSIETKFPAIVFDDTLTSETALSCKSTVSSLNDNKINFRISFDKSDDEDYTVIFDKNSFSYKVISTNDLKTDSKNDNDKVNMLLLPSPEPTVSYFDDLDFFKDFENEFPAIVYNDAVTSKSGFLTEPTVSRQHIDEFDLKDETLLSECNEEEQNVLHFNGLFLFNVIFPDDSKLDEDNDDDKINFKQSSGGNIVYTACPNPTDTAYSLSGRYPVFIFSIVYTTYSLNEYSVYRIRRIDFLYSFRYGFGDSSTLYCQGEELVLLILLALSLKVSAAAYVILILLLLGSSEFLWDARALAIEESAVAPSLVDFVMLSAKIISIRANLS